MTLDSPDHASPDEKRQFSTDDDIWRSLDEDYPNTYLSLLSYIHDVRNYIFNLNVGFCDESAMIKPEYIDFRGIGGCMTFLDFWDFWRNHRVKNFADFYGVEIHPRNADLIAVLAGINERVLRVNEALDSWDIDMAEQTAADLKRFVKNEKSSHFRRN